MAAREGGGGQAAVGPRVRWRSRDDDLAREGEGTGAKEGEEHEISNFRAQATIWPREGGDRRHWRENTSSKKREGRRELLHPLLHLRKNGGEEEGWAWPDARTAPSSRISWLPSPTSAVLPTLPMARRPPSWAADNFAGCQTLGITHYPTRNLGVINFSSPLLLVTGRAMDTGYPPAS
ncbi:hypothetical protein BRADI_4g13219v3 [Brachypodium distachyon]|uniref:Uncharacterized protein n=1 Tax=Brachypodium distachyon TaxID=15368 RepID=A0A0Q3IN75_BRADI|nr:hypothetical protein BRADI_4g13219v3 [Brachypodium distachyon]